MLSTYAVTAALLAPLSMLVLADSPTDHRVSYFVTGITSFTGTIVVPPRTASGGTPYLWPGLEPSDYSGVLQNVLDGRNEHWYFGNTWVGSPSEPYGGGVDASVNEHMGFTMTETSTGSGDWHMTSSDAHGNVADYTFNLGKQFNQALFVVELYPGTNWDFGDLVFLNSKIVAKTDETSWCTDAPEYSDVTINIQGVSHTQSGGDEAAIGKGLRAFEPLSIASQFRPNRLSRTETSTIPSRRRLGLAAAAGLASTSTFVAAAPCDIYNAAGTPCVAAHSTTRALYNGYTGALYQVQRNSDGATQNIYPLSSGVANAASQDTFCVGATCSIAIIYDQSGNGNDISRAPKGAFSGPQSDGTDDLAGAVGAPVTLNGQKAYGVFVSPGTGYRRDSTTAVATGDTPQSVYAVLDGTHFNDNCCFDYGNAETSNTDTGDAHMEAIYYGTCTVWDKGAGSGPWIMADLENGLYSSNAEFGTNSNDPTQTSRFITAMVKGEPGTWAIKGANAQSGNLSTYYNGARPNGYNPMHKEGSIILGIGGDNSNGAQGTFYEGVMTATYASDATDNAVQANVVQAGYKAGNLNNGTVFTPGQNLSFHVTTPGFTNRYLSLNSTNDAVVSSIVSSSSALADRQRASWTVRAGLGQSSCFSFESVASPGTYIRHYGFELYSQSNDGSEQFGWDATFCTQAGLNGQGDSIRSWSYPARYFRHYYNVAYVASQGGPQNFDSTYSYQNDVSFLIASSLA